MPPVSSAQPPDRFWQGVTAFNRHAFFDSHELLEALWLEETDAKTRTLYQGIIQLAVGCYKIHTQPNFIGARNKLKKAIGKLTPLCDVSPWEDWLDLSGLVTQSQQTLDQLLFLGPEGFETLPPASLPRINRR